MPEKDEESVYFSEAKLRSSFINLKDVRICIEQSLTLWRREAALSRHERLPEYGARLLLAAALPSLGPSLVTSLCVEIFSRDKCPPVGGKMNYVVASGIEISRCYAIKREQRYPTAAPSPKSTAWVAQRNGRQARSSKG